MTVEALRAVLGSAEFTAGLRFGLIALAIGLAAALARHAGFAPAATPAIVGLMFATAVALGLHEALELPNGLTLGLVALAGAGAAGALPGGGLLAPLLAVPGSWLVVSGSGLELDRWVRLPVGAAIVVGGWLVADVDARWRRQGLGPMLLAISVAGVYTTVPDTEQALIALGAALPLALLGRLWPLAALGRAGAYAATGALCWVVVAGGSGRGSAVVGGVACLGLFAVEPAARLLPAARPSVLDGPRQGRRGTAAAVAWHLGLVYVAARVAGLRPSAAGAVAVVAMELLAALGLVVAATITRTHRIAGQPTGPLVRSPATAPLGLRQADHEGSEAGCDNGPGRQRGTGGIHEHQPSVPGHGVRMTGTPRPLATIVITTRDRPELLGRAVDSALAQTVRELEVIVVDDGSAEPVRMERSDPRLRVLRNDRPLGVSAARNRGLWAAEGHWVTFTDDDDELLPEMLQISLEAAERSTLPPPVAVLSGLEVLDHRGRVIEIRQPTTVPRGTPPFRGAPDNAFSQDLNTLFAPVELLRSMGGWDDRIKSWEMDDLVIRLAEVSSLEGAPPVAYRRFRHQGPRISNNAEVALTGCELVLRKHSRFFGAHRQLHARHLATLSVTYLRAGRWWPAVRAMSSSVLADPRRQRALQQWMGTLTGPRVYGSYLRIRRRRIEAEAASSSHRRG